MNHLFVAIQLYARWKLNSVKLTKKVFVFREARAAKPYLFLDEPNYAAQFSIN